MSLAKKALEMPKSNALRKQIELFLNPDLEVKKKPSKKNS